MRLCVGHSSDVFGGEHGELGLIIIEETVLDEDRFLFLLRACVGYGKIIMGIVPDSMP